MSGVMRESLNPGLDEEREARNNVVSSIQINVDPPSSDEGGAEGGGGKGHGGGHGNDSDPPIENENPEGDECFVIETSINVSSILSGNEPRKRGIEHVKKRAQQVYRKRRKSSHNTDSSYVPPYKKNRFRHLPSVLPSKFLLGGNIRDPLNLASLSDARISAELNKATPQSSPLPVQGEVPVFIPKNPQDPLGLTTKTPENVEDIVAGVRKNSCSRKHRHRKRPGRKRTDSECSIGTEAAGDAALEEELIIDKTADMVKIQQKETRQNEVKNTVQIELLKNKEVLRHEPQSEPLSNLKNTTFINSSTSAVTITENTPSDSSVDCLTLVSPTDIATSSKHSYVTDSEPSTSREILEPSVTSSGVEKSTSDVNVDHEEYEYQDYVQGDEGRLYYGSIGTGPYNRSSSDYKPRTSSTYAPSPFAFDSTEYFLEPPYSPFSHFANTPTHHFQPFSPPPLPEIPPFQRRMQMFSARPQQLSLQRAVFHRPSSFPKKRGKNRADPIVSPVIPQPGSRWRGHHFHNNHKKPGDKANPSGDSTSAQVGNISTGSANDSVDGGSKKKYRAKDKVFQFGNYSHYYGYRTPEQGDPRLWALKKEYFQGKEVLDIGCNSGHVTLSIARDFEPRRIHGIDIDYSLITEARKNIKHYMIRDPDNKDIVFPKSLPMLFGSMQPPPAPGDKTANLFPYNVSFAHENYVLNSDTLLDSVKPQYDVIICFSVTKWIHLNFGDDGLKRFFKRIFLHLNDGGMFILESQPWSSYKKKNKLTEKIHKMFKSIKFYPDQFEEFLLKVVGFATSESLGTPVHNSKGFQRPLLLFAKSTSVTDRSPLGDNLRDTSEFQIRTTPCTITSGSRDVDAEDLSHSSDYIISSTTTHDIPLQCNPGTDSEMQDSETSNMVSSSSDLGSGK